MASLTKKPTIELILNEIQQRIADATEQKTIMMLCDIITNAGDIPDGQIVRTYQKLIHWARILTTPDWQNVKTQLLATAQELLAE